MKEGQNQIYYLAGESKEAIQSSPLLEKLMKRGYEVLYMVDPIDEYSLADLEKFDAKYKMTNIGRVGLTFEDDTTGEEKEKEKEQKEQLATLTDFLKNVLGNKVR